ncbi:MAG: tripartite tricarboxylate transporter substrate binding protein [Proteobacteria bacterium]|nr:tripartite tricarboxylate transporter substrate binding protein [Burkholderiales bacterium]
MNLQLCMLALSGALLSTIAGAQPWPSKPISVIVPLAAGSPSDLAVRTVTDQLSSALGQQFRVENVLGAGGQIGAERLARAPRDGHTVGAMNNAIIAVLPNLNPKVGYDPFKSFAPVAVFVGLPTVISVHPSLPVTNVKELIALAKKRPNELLYVTGGVGSAQHLSTAMFEWMAGVKMVHVPHKGVVTAVQDILGGHAHVFINSIGLPLPFIKAGKLRAIATTGRERNALLPELPTVAESGVPGYEFSPWTGMFAPAGVPREVITRLNGEIQKIMKLPEVRERYEAQALEVLFNTPEEVTERMTAEFARFGRVIREAGIKAE